MSDSVPPELLTIGTETLSSERDFAERFNVRASALIAVTGIILTLTVNLGQEIFDQLTPASGKTPLDLGSVGKPIFIACFMGAVLALSLCAVVASTAVLPSKARRLKVEALRNYEQSRVPMADVRRRVYTAAINTLEDQRAINEQKAGRLKVAALILVAGIVLVAVDAITLAVQHIG